MLAGHDPLAGRHPLAFAGPETTAPTAYAAIGGLGLIGGWQPLAFAGPTTAETTVSIVATDSFASLDLSALPQTATPPVLIAAMDSMRWSDGLKPDDAPAPSGEGGGETTVDTFTGAAGTNLASHAPDAGGSWASADTDTGSNAVLTAAGRVRADQFSATPSSIFYWTTAPASADYSVSADAYAASTSEGGGGGAAVTARCVPNAGVYVAALYDPVFNRVKLLDGGTAVASVDVSWAAGSTHRIGLAVSGGTASVSVDGVSAIGPTAVSPSAAGYAGILFPGSGDDVLSDSVGVHLDNFSADIAASPAPVVYGASPETVRPLGGDSAWLGDSRGSLAAALSARDAAGFLDSLAFVVVAGPTLISASDRFGLSDGATLGATLSARDLAAFVSALAPPSYLVSARDAFGFVDASGPLAVGVGGWDRFAFDADSSLAATLGGGDGFTTGDGGTPLVFLGVQVRSDGDRIAFADKASIAISIGDLDAFGFFDQSAASALLSGSDGFAAWSEAALAGLAPFAVASIDAAGFQASSALQAAPVGLDALAWLESSAIGVGVSSLDAFTVPDLASISLTVTALDAFGFDDAGAWRAFTATLVYNVYANEGDGGPIDYTSALATVDGLSWISPPLAAGSDWWFAVRAYSVATGLEESNIDAAVRVLIDDARRDVTSRPDPPTAIRASALAGGMIRVEWSDKRPAGTGRATGYRVYQGAGSVDWSTPVADVPADAGIAGAFFAVVGPLTHGTVYAFGVRAYNASSEETNTSQATATADAEGPDAVGGFSIGLTSES